MTCHLRVYFSSCDITRYIHKCISGNQIFNWVVFWRLWYDGLFTFWLSQQEINNKWDFHEGIERRQMAFNFWQPSRWLMATLPRTLLSPYVCIDSTRGKVGTLESNDLAQSTFHWYSYKLRHGITIFFHESWRSLSVYAPRGMIHLWEYHISDVTSP